MVKLLMVLGFVQVSQKGKTIYVFCLSRRKSKNDPCHKEDLGRGIIRKILKDTDLTVSEYERLREKI